MGPDARVVGNPTVLHGDVEVEPHEHGLAGKLTEVGNASQAGHGAPL